MAVSADVDALVAMGQQFLTTTRYATQIANNPAQMAALAAHLIADEDGAIFVAEHAGTLTGMLGVLVTAHHLSAERVGMEAFWWSGTPGDGVRLVRASEAWARSRGAVAMQMVAPDTRVGALYARMGYDLIEHGYLRRLAS